MNALQNVMGAVTASLLVLAVLPTQATADPILATFTFTGLCDDCAGEDTLTPNNPANIDDRIFLPVSGTLILDLTPSMERGDDDRPTIGNQLPVLSVNSENFVSFHYNGSSLLNPFTVIANPQTRDAESEIPNGLTAPFLAGRIGGTLDLIGNVISDFSLNFFSNLPNGELVDNDIHFPTDPNCALVCNFSVATDGEWSIESGQNIQDVGIVGTFATTVPEPGTLAILGIGLVGLGLARRRKAA